MTTDITTKEDEEIKYAWGKPGDLDAQAINPPSPWGNGFTPEEETVNHPKHYNAHPSGVECIDIIEHMPFNTGSAVKYIWRAGLKAESPVEDLRKAIWYLEREIERIGGTSGGQ